MPPPIQKLSAKFLTDPKTIEASRPATANINIDQRVVEVSADKKRAVLRDILRGGDLKNAIIFCNRKTTVRELASSLKRSGFSVGQIHGDMEQSDRIAEFDRFKKDEINILVASDVAARGLDVKGVSHVINFDVPWQPDDYVHRIGRTGRAGLTGVAISFATPQDREQVAAIEKLLGQKIKPLGAGGDATAHPAGKAEPKADTSPEKAAKAGDEREPARKSRTRKRPGAKASPEPKAKAASETKAEPRADKPREEKPAPKATREKEPDAPVKVAEDADAEWNGPLPSFLTVSAG
jgi:superfamily II DNA/RNA helicase